MDIRWLLVLAVIFLFIERWVYQSAVLRRLNYRRSFSTNVVAAGQDVQLVEVIENGKWLPVPWVVLEATFDTSLKFQTNQDLNVRQSERYQNHRSYFTLRPYTRITRRHVVKAVRRGVYRMDTAAMTCGDLFGLQAQVKEWKLTGNDTVLTVLPLIRDVSNLSIPAHSWQGDVVVRRFILPDPFIKSGVRAYQPGDSLNQINWKATARTGSLQVHQQEFTSDYRIQILLNFEVVENMWDQVTEPERVEAGIVMAASIANRMISQGMPVGFACNGLSVYGEECERISPVGGQAQLQRLLLTMAELDIRVSTSFANLLTGLCQTRPTSTDYVVITGFVDGRIQSSLDALRRFGNSVEVITLPAVEDAATWTAVDRTSATSNQSELNRDAG